MLKDSYDLTLDSEVFSGIKQDFDNMVARSINTMQQKNVNAASVTLKLDINFPEGKCDGDECFLFPTFTHKVTASLQFKSEKCGYIGGPAYKLVWDYADKLWKLTNIDNDQVSFYDDDCEGFGEGQED